MNPQSSIQFKLTKTCLSLAACSILTLSSCVQTKKEVQKERPNILFCIADDQSFPHAGAYGCDWVITPAFDRVAREGILFTNAYTPNAKCAPSRACIITGRNSWQLEAAANHWCYFPEKFKTYAEVLKEYGYFTGYTAKGWAPGITGTVDGKPRELLGKEFIDIKTTPPTPEICNVDYVANFKAFLDANKEGKPFCFWYGSREPHRAYEFQSGIKKGNMKKETIDHVFKFWPDNDSIRTDMLDYSFEIEYFDKQLERMLQILEERGLIDNTLVVVTADNGMPFPRIKGQEYEYSNHLPLAMMWKNGIKDPGRTFKGIVSFTDFAPTFLNLAHVNPDSCEMKPIEGRSLIGILKNEKEAKGRDFMVIGKESHDVGRPNDEGYPIRGIIQDGYLYLKNLKVDRWPAGNPECGYLNCDGSPTKSFILNDRRRNGHSTYWDLSFEKRGEEELYKISEDPECMVNLANSSKYNLLKAKLEEQLTGELKKESDPRMFGNGDIFDHYPYADELHRNFYNRLMAGEDLIPIAVWVNPTDFEREFLNTP